MILLGGVEVLQRQFLYSQGLLVVLLLFSKDLVNDGQIRWVSIINTCTVTSSLVVALLIETCWVIREPIHSWDDFDNLQVGFIHTKQKKRGEKPLFCTPAGVRTLDTLIKSQVLYQLSYGCNENTNALYLCTPAEARTLDTLIKSQVLYQLSYGCIVFSIAGAKVRSIFDSTKLF